MAIQNIKCPNCGGEVEMNDDLENGFCMYCGGAIQIKEEVTKMQIEHSGKVEIDDTKKMANSLALADRAFEAGNYEECYSYCCTALECDVNNAHATFRKGLCAAYLSFARTSELEQSLKTAKAIIRDKSEDADKETYVIFTEMLEFIRSAYTLNCNRAKGFTYPNIAAANNHFSIVATLTTLTVLCADLITNKMMEDHPTFESDKRTCLELGLELCEQGVSSLKYFAGYKTVKKGDGYVQKEVYESVKSPHFDMQKNYQTKFKDDFNNLPTTKKALDEYDGQINNLQKDIDAFTNKLEEYFTENPEIGKEYKKSATPFVALTGLAFVLVAVCGGSLANTMNTTVFGLLMALLSCGFVGLAIFTGIRLVQYSKNRKRILSELPPDLTCLKTVHDQSQIQLRTVKHEKAAFVKKNVKK